MRPIDELAAEICTLAGHINAAHHRWLVLIAEFDQRRTGGEGNDRWVLSTYRVTGKTVDSRPIDHTTLETVILRRSGAGFRIVHVHWSTSDGAFQAEIQRQRRSEDPPRATR